MVQIFCIEEKCRKIVHLDNHEHWNCKGRVRYPRSGAEMEVEIEDGKLRSLNKTE